MSFFKNRLVFHDYLLSGATEAPEATKEDSSAAKMSSWGHCPPGGRVV